MTAVNICVKVWRDPSAEGIPLPEFKTPLAAGMDICAVEDVDILPGMWAAVSTGLAVEIPEGYGMDVRSRSGLANREGIFVLNSPGLVDADYRGVIKVILANLGDAVFSVRRGDRIAQLTFFPVVSAEWQEVPDQAALAVSSRGAGGFGSTGV